LPWSLELNGTELNLRRMEIRPKSGRNSNGNWAKIGQKPERNPKTESKNGRKRTETGNGHEQNVLEHENGGTKRK